MCATMQKLRYRSMGMAAMRCSSSDWAPTAPRAEVCAHRLARRLSSWSRRQQLTGNCCCTRRPLRRIVALPGRDRRSCTSSHDRISPFCIQFCPVGCGVTELSRKPSSFKLFVSRSSPPFPPLTIIFFFWHVGEGNRRPTHHDLLSYLGSSRHPCCARATS